MIFWLFCLLHGSLFQIALITDILNYCVEQYETEMGWSFLRVKQLNWPGSPIKIRTCPNDIPGSGKTQYPCIKVKLRCDIPGVHGVTFPTLSKKKTDAVIPGVGKVSWAFFESADTRCGHMRGQARRRNPGVLQR